VILNFHTDETIHLIPRLAHAYRFQPIKFKTL